MNPTQHVLVRDYGGTLEPRAKGAQLAEATGRVRIPWVRVAALVVFGGAWVSFLWMQTPAYGALGALAWIVGGIEVLTFRTGPAAWNENRGLPVSTVSRPIQALLLAGLLVATAVVDVIIDASPSPWILVIPIAVFVYADFWVWVLRAGLRSVARNAAS